MSCLQTSTGTKLECLCCLTCLNPQPLAGSNRSCNALGRGCERLLSGKGEYIIQRKFIIRTKVPPDHVNVVFKQKDTCHKKNVFSVSVIICKRNL